MTEAARPQGEIIIDTSRQTKLDFSNIPGNFDKVYSHVHNGFQDKAGNIWFSTTGAGTIRFDGKFFTHITTIDQSNNNSITALLEDKQRNIWFAAANGIYRYDGKIFTHIPTESADNTIQTSTLNTFAKRTSLSVISAMREKKGNIWFGTETSGIYRYD